MSPSVSTRLLVSSRSILMDIIRKCLPYRLTHTPIPNLTHSTASCHCLYCTKLIAPLFKMCHSARTSVLRINWCRQITRYLSFSTCQGLLYHRAFVKLFCFSFFFCIFSRIKTISRPSLWPIVTHSNEAYHDIFHVCLRLLQFPADYGAAVRVSVTGQTDYVSLSIEHLVSMADEG